MDSNSKIFVNNIGVRMGRPSLVSQNLEFVAPVKEFVAQHSAAAHNRHRQDTEYCHGVSKEDIHRHLLQTIPELKNISKSNVRRLLLPPQKNRKAASKDADLIEAKVPPKWNDLTVNEHKDFHFICAQVNYIGKLSEMVVDEARINHNH